LLAPFVVSHMQLGLLLQNLGASLLDMTHERAGVYLTNALTGWEPMDPEKEKAFQAMLTGFPQLLEEQADARKVKQQVPILVILGNPPYNAFAGTAPTKEEKDSVTPYKEGLIKKWGIKKFNLDDLYVRFFRMSEVIITTQKPYKGIVCFISNFSYLADPSFVVMRERFLGEFDRLWFDNMNGDSRETGKRTPDGKPDPSVFSTEYNKAGIRKGTAVTILARKTERKDQPVVRYRQFWGSSKRSDLLNTLMAPDINSDYQLLQPATENRHSFRPSDASSTYLIWPRLADLSALTLQGMDEDRANALIGIEPKKLEKLMEKYFEESFTWEQFAALGTGLSRESAAFKPQKVREKAQKEDEFSKSNIRRYLFRPYDMRWCYYSSVPNVWKRSRPELWRQHWDGNAWLLSRTSGVAEPEGTPFLFSKSLVARDSMRGHAVAFPIRLLREVVNNKKPKEQAHLIQPEEEDNQATANLSPAARSYLSSLGITNPDADAHTAGLIWMHALAVGYSPAYLSENADGIRKDWPRIPLPEDKALLEASAALGEIIAALLDTENLVSGVIAPPIRTEIQNIAVITKEGGGQLQPKELAVTAGWGHAGQNSVVMPGKGKAVERDYTVEEKQSIVSGAEKLGIPPEKALDLLGEGTFDIYLNEVAYWKNVPAKVWEYTIGGYQVIKKWLSYRENDLLGRPLTPDEAREVMNMARRIAAIILLHPTLDENYYQCKANTYKW